MLAAGRIWTVVDTLGLERTLGTNTGGLAGSQPWEVGVEGLYLIVDCFMQ